MEYALVTGGSSGMGLQYCLQLAQRGYGIIVVSNRPDENIKAADTIRGKYGNTDIRIIDADLTEPDSARSIYAQTSGWGITISVLVSNAGILLFSTLLKTKPENLDRIIALHCTTPAKLIRFYAEDMKKRGNGYILIMSSATAWMQYPTISHYGATKAFLKNFSRSLWYEMKGTGVGVTAVFPGAVDTSLYNFPEQKRRLLRKLGIMSTPEKTVKTALDRMFRKKYRCIPGAFTKIIVFICATAPAFLLLPLLKLPAVKKILEKV